MDKNDKKRVNYLKDFVRGIANKYNPSSINYTKPTNENIKEDFERIDKRLIDLRDSKANWD